MWDSEAPSACQHNHSNDYTIIRVSKAKGNLEKLRWFLKHFLIHRLYSNVRDRPLLQEAYNLKITVMTRNRRRKGKQKWEGEKREHIKVGINTRKQG